MAGRHQRCASILLGGVDGGTAAEQRLRRVHRATLRRVDQCRRAVLWVARLNIGTRIDQRLDRLDVAGCWQAAAWSGVSPALFTWSTVARRLRRNRTSACWPPTAADNSNVPLSRSKQVESTAPAASFRNLRTSTRLPKKAASATATGSSKPPMALSIQTHGRHGLSKGYPRDGFDGVWRPHHRCARGRTPGCEAADAGLTLCGEQ